MHLLRPSAAALRHGRPAARARLRRRRRQPRRRHRAEREPGRIRGSARQVRSEPGRHARPSKTSRRRSKSATRCSPGVAPEQAKCNYWTLAFRNVASLESENIGVGTRRARRLRARPERANNEGYPSSAPANGGVRPNTSVRSAVIIDNNHLHVNPYPNVSGPGPARRSAKRASENFIPSQAVIGNVPASLRPAAANSPRARRTCSAKSTRPRR